MTGPAGTPTPWPPRTNWRLVSLSIAVAGIVLLVGANAHLVYVALVSQPECVPHAKDAGAAGVFRAAQPAC